MPWYRLFHLNGGHIFHADEFEAEDDVAAVRLAEQRTGQHALELWSGARRVKFFDAVPPAPGSESG